MQREHAAVEFTAQCGEDKWLAGHWSRFGLPDVGFFVDFGAGDGKTFSNTYWLEHRKGWSGLLCEPDPRHVIADRPNSIIERVAIGRPGKVSLGLTNDPYLTGSLRTEGPAAHPRLAVCDRVEVDSVPLTTLLERHGIERVDLISVDTEGTEIEAWRTLDLSRWRPRVAIVEYSTWELNDDLAGVQQAMATDGYELVRVTAYNGIFMDGR